MQDFPCWIIPYVIVKGIRKISSRIGKDCFLLVISMGLALPCKQLWELTLRYLTCKSMVCRRMLGSGYCSEPITKHTIKFLEAQLGSEYTPSISRLKRRRVHLQLVAKLQRHYSRLLPFLGKHSTTETSQHACLLAEVDNPESKSEKQKATSLPAMHFQVMKIC